MGGDYTVLKGILWYDNSISCHLCFVSPCLFIWAGADAFGSLLCGICKSSSIVSLLCQIVCSQCKVGVKMSPRCSSRLLRRHNTSSVGLIRSDWCHRLFTYAEMMGFEVMDQSLDSWNVRLTLRWLHAVLKLLRRLFKSTITRLCDKVCLVVQVSLLFTLAFREIVSCHCRMLKFIRGVVADISFSHTKVALSEFLTLLITGLSIDWLRIFQFFMDILRIRLPYSA